MGFFSSAFGSVCSFVSSAVDTVGTIISEGKKIAAQALGKMADFGEKVVRTVKDVWAKAKPFLQQIQAAANVVQKVPGIKSIPWVLEVAIAIDKGLTALFALENSPVLKKVAAGVEWAIDAARHLSEKWLTEEELKEAEERKRHFAAAAGSLNQEQQRAVLFAEIINEFVMVRTRLQGQIDHGEMGSFDHYLRLRAVQKLVVDTNRRLQVSGELEDVSVEDLHVLQIAAQLLCENPVVSNEDLQFLNRVITARYGKELIPFVFEELVQGWALDLGHDQQRYEQLSNALCEEESRFETLEANASFGLLSPEEETVLEKLRQSVPAEQESLRKLFLENNRRLHYIDAAEGLLQALENRLEAIIVERIPEVGGLIIGCMEKGVQWDALKPEEKDLVIDFANVFRRDRQRRGEKLAREAEVMVGVTA